MHRGLPCLVTQTDGTGSPQKDTGHRPTFRARAQQFAAASPQRTPRLTAYTPSQTVRPARPLPDNPHPSSEQFNVKRLIGGLLIVAAFVAACALVGMTAARFFIDYVDDSVALLDNSSGENNRTRAESLSEPQSRWQKGSVPVLYQGDPQWADRPYASGTIASSGAAPLCLTMVYVNLTGDTKTTPVDIASFSQQSGYANQADATDLLTKGAAELGIVSEAIPARESSIREALVRGRPVIAAVHPGAFGPSETYLVLTDIDEYGMLIINDPLSSERSGHHWSFEDLCAEATSLWAYHLA